MRFEHQLHRAGPGRTLFLHPVDGDFGCSGVQPGSACRFPGAGSEGNSVREAPGEVTTPKARILRCPVWMDFAGLPGSRKQEAVTQPRAALLQINETATTE